MGEENHEYLQSGATYTFEGTDQGEPHYEGDSLKGEGVSSIDTQWKSVSGRENSQFERWECAWYVQESQEASMFGAEWMRWKVSRK